MSNHTPSSNPHLKLAVEFVASHLMQATEESYHLADDQRFFDRATYIECRNVIRRVLIERAVIRSAANALTAAGFELRVHNGNGWATEWTSSVDAVMDAVMEPDLSRHEDRIYARSLTTTGEIRLIYGDDGENVIHDQSVSLAEVLQDTNDFADALSEVL